MAWKAAQLLLQLQATCPQHPAENQMSSCEMLLLQKESMRKLQTHLSPCVAQGKPMNPVQLRVEKVSAMRGGVSA
jgi:hypothetical protein